MWIPRCICVCLWFTVFVCGQDQVRLPPSITKGPDKELIFRPPSTVTLECKAEGPGVEYRWKKDGVDFNLNQRRIHKDMGDITIESASAADDGFYQCFASNHYGTALSNVAHIRAAFLHGLSSSINIVTMPVTAGRPFVIDAARPNNSLPTPTYNWEYAKGTADPSPKKLEPSRRMQVACNGDLYFAYAKKEDGHGGDIYKNTVFNSVMDVKQGAGYTRLNVVQEGSDPLPDFPPKVTYSSKSQDIALIGGFIILKCFFSGNPLPTITWSRPGKSLNAARHKFSDFETRLNISDINHSDEGEYICRAQNSNGTVQHTHQVQVEAVPTFRTKSDGPNDVNATEGESVTFNCSAIAEPEATVAWLRNGQPIDVTNGPRRFVFSDDKKSLTIRDVCRDCTDRETDGQTDLTVIQCNASNVHGYAFASGYLNVLRRTKVTLLPTSTNLSVNFTKENRFQIDCVATSDPSTPPTVQWYKVGDKTLESVHSDAPHLHVTNGKLTIYIGSNCTDECYKYLGEYRCVGNTIYSSDNATVFLNGTRDPWYKPAYIHWIVIGVSTLLFLLLLLLICCVVLHFTKGDAYDVDRMEKKSGKFPEEEIHENDFQEYYPRDYDQRKGSDPSVGSNGEYMYKRRGSPASLGGASMFRDLSNIDEYYDEENMNFGEDGSFVGKYSGMKTASKSQLL